MAECVVPAIDAPPFRGVKRVLYIVMMFVLVAIAANLAWGQDVAKMVGSNFLLGSEGKGFCSATLLAPAEKRVVLTNYHCVEDAIVVKEVEEPTSDGTYRKVQRAFVSDMTLWQHAYGDEKIVGRTELRAKIVAYDKSVDLAALRILSETTPLPHSAPLPPEGYALAQGQVVVAVGNPMGLENTVSRGTLNHLRREFKWSPEHIAWYVQTDAVIAGGSSGGALYAPEGYLVGVPSAGFRGAPLNFAIPFPVIRAFLTKHKLIDVPGRRE